MATSANVIEYSIYRGDDEVGQFRQHIMCKDSNFAELLKYQPLYVHNIQAWGYDEEEEEWYDEPQNLENFLKGIKTNKLLVSYFSGEKTVEQIMQELEQEEQEETRKILEYLEKRREKRMNS